MSLVEFIHAVGYYRARLKHPGLTGHALLASISDAVGDKTLGRTRTEFFAVYDGPPHIHPPEWIPSSDLPQYHSPKFRGDIRERLLLDDLRLAGRHLSLVSSLRKKYMPVHRWFDLEWDVVYEGGNDRLHSQVDTQLRASVATSFFFDKPEGPRARDLIRQFVLTMDGAGDLYYLLVTTSQIGEDGAGNNYGSGIVGPSTLRFQIEQELWRSLGRARREKVRGIYWGQYLSPWHLERLGGKGAFRDAYMREVSSKENKDNFVEELPSGGLFVKVSDNPMFASVKGLGVPCGQVGAWLHGRFRDAGLLL